MDESFLSSSDSIRTAQALKHAHYVTLSEPLFLQLGGRLDNVRVCYETYGHLNSNAGNAAGNAVLICHALSGDSHVARHDENDDAGWWDLIVGPGKPIDTESYFVICPNLLGGCRGTTGPNSINPSTGRRFGRDFPVITIEDMVNVQKRLVERLGIKKLQAVVGGSLGGQLVLCWAHKYPGHAEGYIPIATTSRLTSQSLAFDIVGRNAILRDPNFHDGQYYEYDKGPDTGLAIARMIGHITYLSKESMQLKFDADRNNPRNVSTDFERRFSVGSYLGYLGDRFVERFDANSYIALTLAMDLFDLSDSREVLARSIGTDRGRWLILSFASDWLFPPEESRLLVEALITAGGRVSYCNVDSDFGHDSLLLEHKLEVYGELIRAFLINLNTEHIDLSDKKNSEQGKLLQDSKARTENEQWMGQSALDTHSAVSIFHPNRLDYDRIIKLIPKGASVLDLGCGHGELLYRLESLGYNKLTGVEIDERAIISCVRLGIDVLQVDLNQHLSPFVDNSYDYVLLSRTLQAVLDVEGLLREIIRIGKQAIVSFPNFAYHKLRRMLAEQGRAPESSGILHNKWFNTPNLRFFSIADFVDLCKEQNIRIHKTIALDTEAGREVPDEANEYADLAIFVISKKNEI